MAYIEEQDLLDELGEETLIQLSDDDGTGVINSPRVLKAIEYAEGIFNSYARSRYSIPVPATPMVKSINLDLAVFHLYKSRTSIAEGIYVVKESAKKDAFKLLNDIRTGNAALDIPATDETIENPANPDKILTNSSANKFNDETLRSF